MRHMYVSVLESVEDVKWERIRHNAQVFCRNNEFLDNFFEAL